MLSIEDIKNLINTPYSDASKWPLLDKIDKMDRIVTNYITNMIPSKHLEVIEVSRTSIEDMQWILEEHKKCLIKQNVLAMINSPILDLI